MVRLRRFSGFPGFIVLWLGQMFSVLGGSMAAFAVTLWMYQKTGQATPVALLGFFQMTPMIVLSLFAGALVDRYPRRTMLMLADSATVVVCVGLIAAQAAGTLEVGWIYAAGALLGTFQSFQWPATSAAVTEMVDKKHYARAASLLEMAGMSSGLVAPLLAGALLGFFGLPGVLILTGVGSLFSIASLFFIDFPPKAAAGAPVRALLKEIGEGFSFVLARPSLIAIQVTFLAGNFFASLYLPLMGPLVLASTGNNALAFATVETAAALGGLAGAAVITVWGGPKNPVVGILTGWSLSGLLGAVVVGVGPGLAFWVAGAFLGSAFGNLNYTSNQALWQAKVPVDLQGRVFAVRRLIAMGVIPLANLLAGPLADHVFGPAMAPGGAWAAALGPWFGTGPGAGMRVLFVISGLAVVLVGPLGWASSLVREAPQRLPDAPTSTKPQEESHA